MALNIRRGIRRICLTLTVVWVPLVLLYPFYSRRQYHDAVNEKADAFYEACLREAGRQYDEALRAFNEASRTFDGANAVGSSFDREKALGLYLQANRTKNDAERAKELGMKKCPEAKDKLVTEVFPPDLNTYQWFVRPKTGRIWLMFDPNTDPNYLIEFLASDIKQTATPPYLPASFVFPAALILPPTFLYGLLLYSVALVTWIVRGFTAASPSKNST